MNEPTPRKTPITWPSAVTLSILFVCVAAVCITGMLLRADLLR